MCISNAKKVKQSDRSKYKIGYKVMRKNMPVYYRHIHSLFHVDGKWNIVRKPRIPDEDNVGFHLFLNKNSAIKWVDTLENLTICKCQIRGVRYIGKTHKYDSIIATQFRVIK